MSHEKNGDSINITGGVKGVVARNISGGIINVVNESPESKGFKDNRQMLIQVVTKEIEDRLKLFKNRNRYINLSLESKPEFVSQIDPITLKEKQKVDNKEIQDIDSLFKHFREKHLPESLLIVGDPASGLTTVLCTIAEILLEKANTDENQPVPVYLSIRSWDGEHLENWLEKAINKHYCIHPEKKDGLGKILYKILGNTIYNRLFVSNKLHLIEPQNLVILLDHFELVNDNKQKYLVKELNKYKICNIVLCSRLEAWDNYILIDENNPDNNNNKLLEFNEAFLLKPPTSSEIQDYSSSVLNESNSDNANKIKTLIKPGQKLEDITKSLFILNLVLDHSYIYKELINLNVLNIEKEELYQNILKIYVDNTLKEIDKQLKRPKEESIVKNLEKTYWEKIKPKVKPMLKWLAQEMCDSLSDKNDKPKPYFLIEEMQPTALKGIAKTSYHFGSVSLAVLLSFLVGTLHLLIQPVDGWKYTLLTGIPGAIFVFFFFFLDGKGEIKPVDRSEWNFQTVKENSLKALFLSPLAFLIGFICSFLEGRGLVELYGKGIEQASQTSLNDFMLGIIYTLIITVMIIMFYSVTVGISSSNVKKVKPNQGIWTSSYNCGVTGFRVFLFASIIFWLLGIIVQKHPLMLATRLGIGYGLMAGMLYAIGCNSGKACIRHFTLRLILFITSRTAWNYAKFLNVAVDNLEFLQRAGGKFLFINRDLRDIFLDYKK